MSTSSTPRRLLALPAEEACGIVVPLAVGAPARLLGLAFLNREQAGPGLLIPRCRSVHTFGMRFALDVCFLDAELEPLRVVRDVPPRRIVSHRAAKAVLETPAAGGEQAARGS